MAGDDPPDRRIVRLKAGSVMCDVRGCTHEAEFLTQQGAVPIRALCEKHLRAMGASDAKIPPPDNK